MGAFLGTGSRGYRGRLPCPLRLLAEVVVGVLPDVAVAVRSVADAQLWIDELLRIEEYTAMHIPQDLRKHLCAYLRKFLRWNPGERCLPDRSDAIWEDHFETYLRSA